MKRKEFKLLLKDYEMFQHNVTRMNNFGVDLTEGLHPTATYAEKFFDIILNQNWNAFGVDWINWFVYENDFGAEKMEAWDDKKLICQTVDELYDYCKQYKKK